tara:strand:+ start:516 stop:1130 length:615 start_codon:yes stop_codon:yes gene_type:complete
MSIVTLNDRAVRSVTAFGSLNTGSIVFIKKLTASSSATLSFVNGSSDVVLDSTYKEYLFTFNNIHPATDGSQFQIGFRDGDTDYDAVKTTTFFQAYHQESGGSAGIQYATSLDLAQSTSFQNITGDLGNQNDECGSGIVQLFNPSSTTFVKHFITRENGQQNNEQSVSIFTAGYCNTTSAIDGVQFKMSSGNIDVGDICLYGIL